MRVPAISALFKGRRSIIMIWILAILAAIIYVCYLIMEGAFYLVIFAGIIVLIVLWVLLVIIINIVKDIIDLIKDFRYGKGR